MLVGKLVGQAGEWLFVAHKFYIREQSVEGRPLSPPEVTRTYCSTDCSRSYTAHNEGGWKYIETIDRILNQFLLADGAAAAGREVVACLAAQSL